MEAGRLRHRLTFQSPTTERDTTGDDLGNYQDEFTVWGSLEPLRGQVFFAAQQFNPEITGLVRVRYSEQTSLIHPSWRLLHDGRTYSLTEPTLNESLRNRQLEMYVAEMPVNADPRN